MPMELFPRKERKLDSMMEPFKVGKIEERTLEYLV